MAVIEQYFVITVNFHPRARKAGDRTTARSDDPPTASAAGEKRRARAAAEVGNQRELDASIPLFLFLSFFCRGGGGQEASG